MQGPIGRIGKPIDDREYRRFEVKGIVLFVALEVLDEAARKQGALKVLMGDYGTWVLRFT